MNKQNWEKYEELEKSIGCLLLNLSFAKVEDAYYSEILFYFFTNWLNGQTNSAWHKEFNSISKEGLIKISKERLESLTKIPYNYLRKQQQKMIYCDKNKKEKHQWKYISSDPDGYPSSYKCKLCGKEQEFEHSPEQDNYLPAWLVYRGYKISI